MIATNDAPKEEPRAAKQLRASAQEYATRAFDAASKRPRLSSWITSGMSANAEGGRALPILRDRARDLARNDPYAARILDLVQSNIVGTGIRPQLPGATPLERKWREWAETTACDADGLNDIYGLQALVVRAMAESGEVLIRRRFRRNSDGLPVPMQLQVLEADHIDSSKDGVADRTGHRRIQGIEFDAIGRRVAYWLHRVHPGERTYQGATSSVRVPAEDVMHLYRVQRPGQVRGIPWLAPVVVRAHDLRAYEDAQLLRQKIAACFAVFEEDSGLSPDPSDLTPPPDPETGDKGTVGEDFVTPGLYKKLPPGRSVKFTTPPSVSGYDEFVSRQLRAIAVGAGFSYEAVTGDLEGVSFSAGRLGHIETGRLTGMGVALMIRGFCKPVWGWFRTAAAIVGVGGEHEPTWIGPAAAMIDRTKEVAARKAEIKGGLRSVSDCIRADGGDPEVVFRQLEDDLKRLKKLGIKVDVDLASMALKAPPA